MPKPYTPNDKWSQRAAKEGYRARSVYKLQELDEKFRLLKPGMTVLDLGAAPGSWLQYASKVVGPAGAVYGCDLQEIATVAPNVTTFIADIHDRFGLQEKLRALGVRDIDIVLADMAPNTSGIKDVDHWKSVELARAAAMIGQDLLGPRGWCVVKVFRGSEFDAFMHEMKAMWHVAKEVSVEASRDRSREVYMVMRKA